MAHNPRVKINQQALNQLGADIAARAEGVVNDVAARMAGGDQAEIQRALEDGLRAKGFEPNATVIAEHAARIAHREPGGR